MAKVRNNQFLPKMFAHNNPAKLPQYGYSQRLFPVVNWEKQPDEFKKVYP
jgi:hypothetical protein